MSEEIEKNIQKELRALLLMDELANILRNDLSLQDKVSERLASSNSGRELRAVIVNRRAAQAYYNKEYAEVLKPYLDTMIEMNCSKPIEFPRHAYPGTSFYTIYLRVYQAWQWLRDHDKERAKYIELYERTHIVKSFKTGVRIQEKKRIAAPLAGLVIEEQFEHLSKLQDEITKALQQDNMPDQEYTMLLDKKGLSLNEDDQHKIQDSLAGIEGLTAIVTQNSVKIIRKQAI